ncbi:MAG: hypothetical protein IJY84_04885 [Clostridia bacterium]|nr:hypothetical protein [Clostridia bacterium]
MEEILKMIGNYFAENAVNWLIGGLILVISVGLGVLIALITWKNLAFKNKVTNSATVQDISHEKEVAKAYFKTGHTTIELEKIGFFVGALTTLAQKIPEKYANTKLYEIYSKENLKYNDKFILRESVKLHLDFTVYELVYFLRSFANGLNEEILKFLNTIGLKTAYFLAHNFGKKAFGETPKNAEDLTIAQLIDIITKLTKKKTEEELPKDENKIKAFFGGFVDKVKGVLGGAIKNVGLKIGNSVIDDLALQTIELFAEEINKLYSEQFKEQIANSSSADDSAKESA